MTAGDKASNAIRSKVLSPDALFSEVSRWRGSGLIVGFTCGAFDLLHAGHVSYLERARSHCDRLIVAVNSDASIRSYKSPLRPIIPQEHRVSVIAALSCVDAITLMPDVRPARLIEQLQPQLYIKGGDYQAHQLRSASLVESYGGRCIVVPIEQRVNTSSIIRRIEQLSTYSHVEPAKRRAVGPLVLLDRDGTIIEDIPFLNTPSRVKLLEGVGPNLRLLQDLGFELVVVTNQQGLGLGYFDYDTFVAINSEMLRQLSSFGVRISKFYFCPHSVAEHCNCRKPGTKLIERALADFNCNAQQCYLIGDSSSDLLAAKASGCTGLLVGRSGLSFGEVTQQIVEDVNRCIKRL